METSGTKQKAAFLWIVNILQKRNIIFQITGGLAARVYGSERPLADIDIDIPERELNNIANDVAKYITFGPKRFVDANWDLVLMTLNYNGQEIDICSDEAKFCDTKTGEWMKGWTDFSKSEIHAVYGVQVPVICKAKLIKYKKILDRSVDRADVRALSKLAS